MGTDSQHSGKQYLAQVGRRKQASDEDVRKHMGVFNEKQKYHNLDMRQAFEEAAARVFKGMREDDSDLALRPDDSEDLTQAVQMVHSLMADAYAASTSKQDWGSHWNWWTLWCKQWNTRPIRYKRLDNMNSWEREREIYLMAAAIPWILYRMKGRGRMWPLPESAAKVIRAVMRIHHTLGYKMAPEGLKSVNLVVKALQTRYTDIHGPESLEPHRKEPMPFWLTEELVLLFTRCLMHSEDRAVKFGGKLVLGIEMWVSLVAMIALHYQSGLRKGESTSQTQTLSKKDMSRASLTWLIDGVVVVAPTRMQLLGMVGGRDFAVVKPPPSKCDTHGITWGSKLMYFLYDEAQHAGAARALRQLELRLPVSDNNRRRTPLFVSAPGVAMSGTMADHMLNTALANLAPDTFGQYSWHSFRRALAVSMLKAGCTPAEIQAVCRWQSEESLWIYAQLEPEDYAAILARSYGQNFQRSMAHNLPTIDEAEMVRGLGNVEI
jgi:hypothetical protein